LGGGGGRWSIQKRSSAATQQKSIYEEEEGRDKLTIISYQKTESDKQLLNQVRKETNQNVRGIRSGGSKRFGLKRISRARRPN